MGAVGAFGLSLWAALCLIGGTVAGALALFSAAHKQGREQFDQAQAVHQLPYVVFFLAAGGLMVATDVRWLWAAACLAMGYGVAAGVGLLGVLRSAPGMPHGQASVLGGRERWQQASTFIAISMSGFLMLYLERFAIPRLLSYADLAVFGVAWTVVGAPFKLLQNGVGFVLFPKLRRAETEGEAWPLLRDEMQRAGLLGVGGGAVLLGGGEAVIQGLYAGKYAVSFPLLGAMVVAGNVRVLHGVSAAAVAGIGEAQTLRLYNRSGWLALLGAVGAIVALHGYGLAGVVAGAALGWGLRVGAGVWAVRPLLVWRSAPNEAVSDGRNAPSSSA